jgi:putative ABC transport system ATP-binding protein
LDAFGLEKRYRLGRVEIPALTGVDLCIRRGEMVGIAGPSGSGKSTLLNLLGFLDRPDRGKVLFEGRDLAGGSERERTLLRRRRLGFVFQAFHLVPVLSALENVEYPLVVDGVGRQERRDRARKILAEVGLSGREHHRPDQLSGGERQRVALARALIHEPLIVLADEPTGNVDSETGDVLLGLMTRLHQDRKTAFLVATHDPAVMDRAPRLIRLRDGRIEADERRAG